MREAAILDNLAHEIPVFLGRPHFIERRGSRREFRGRSRGGSLSDGLGNMQHEAERKNAEHDADRSEMPIEHNAPLSGSNCCLGEIALLDSGKNI